MAKSKNSNLHGAKTAKNDEFYTQLPDIENELYHYREHFRDKVVFCNCDDPEESKFWTYFSLNFEFFGLKRLISTHFENGLSNQKAYKLEIFEDRNGDGKINKLDMVKTLLEGDGDFRSEECVKILDDCDIVVTNPPFSLFREFIGLMDKHKKKYIIIGNKNAITYKESFGLIKDNKMWLGITSPDEFKQPEGSEIKNLKGLCLWFTNLPHKKRNEKLTLFRNYYGCESDYPKYDNYDAINIDKTAMIPFDYEGVMGVPITFLDKFNPEQFEVVGITDRQDTYNFRFKKYNINDSLKFNDLNAGGVLKINNEYKCIYARILIKNKNPQRVMGIDNE